MMEAISKAKQKWIRSLQLKKNRDEEYVFVVEGEKMVLEGLSCGLSDLVLLVVENEYIHIVPELAKNNCFSISHNDLSQLSSFKTPNKLIAVFKRREQQTDSTKKGIVLDGVQDPGNLGTILRIADWFGVSQIICSHETVEVYNPKVIQASMGAIYRVNVVYTDLKNFLTNSEQPTYAALLDGTDFQNVSFEENALLIMGNEGKGINNELLPFINHRITIPKVGQAESLNVGTATAILAAKMMLG
jgi:TrmH family RNA methyltransferase